MKLSLRHRGSSRARAGRALAAVLVFFAVAGALVWRFCSQSSATLDLGSEKPRAITARGDLDAEEQRLVALFQRASPAVVNVTNIALARNRFNFDITEIPQGTGSGFIWDDRGFVVTNNHVVANGGKFRVTLADGTELDAREVGTDPDHDIAVLRVEAPKGRLVALSIGTSGDLLVGQKVLAIGSPFSLDQTLTTGIISGLHREIRSVTNRRITDVIQTDAAINPGNSGGPLLDSSGRLIGMNTAIVSSSGSSAGIGFAVPVDTINEIVPQLISGESLKRPGLGIRPLSDLAARRMRIQGVPIYEAPPGSSAERAGLRSMREFANGDVEFDVIFAVNGKPVKSLADLYDVLDGHEIGDEVDVSVRRGEGVQRVRVVLQPVSK